MATSSLLLLLLGTCAPSCLCFIASGTQRYSSCVLMRRHAACTVRSRRSHSVASTCLQLEASTKDGFDDDGSRNRYQQMEEFNEAAYSELRTFSAVSTGASLDSADEKPLLPNPELSAQQSIAAVLTAMKLNSKTGCRVYLRFMSEHNAQSNLTPQELEDFLKMSGEMQVLLGNFR
ncbi:hypothetical protein GUITHDRAFT_140936 [Guillardia theta CCMP2712]|uniref:Uncharacterized protein n=3 Tax=Guillardia theta TaxID=55529 RepID=L1J3Y0_GUITC|nr:hypothetical protein GUITHDRAFT_140936 [Guillardia theta CCMP2712]EKX42780.1 hypothetical protein GUITHDRAFT_140936 [Guillardia theta CCMP2712]|eukprot:XP_005829760.1 hypothetical protein GUITHDRAFT_140936 [Guillardia theta CCMP2712]